MIILRQTDGLSKLLGSSREFLFVPEMVDTTFYFYDEIVLEAQL